MYVNIDTNCIEEIHIPRFVADYIERAKNGMEVPWSEDIEKLDLMSAFYEVDMDGDHELHDWMSRNSETFALAYIFGYIVT